MSFAKRFLLMVAVMSAAGGAAIGLTVSTHNGLEGIPRRLLPVYEAKVAAVKAKDQLRKDLANQPHPRAHVHAAEHDFGLVDGGARLEHDYTIENVGDEPLTIAIESIGCDCVVGRTTDNEILPGQTGQVHLSWTVAAQSDPEPVEKVALVRTNDPIDPIIRLTVTGQLRRDVMVPAKVDFGKINPGETASKTFFVVSQQWDAFDVNDITSELAGFDWVATPMDDAEKLQELDCRSGWAVTVEASGSKTSDYCCTAAVSVTGPDGTSVDREVTFVGKMRAAISFYSDDLHSHEGLDIGTVRSDRDHQWFIHTRVRGPHRPPLQIIDVKPDALQASIESLDDDGREYRLTLTIPAGAERAEFNRSDAQGYVNVGDPATIGFDNWFPIHGAIVPARSSAP